MKIFIALLVLFLLSGRVFGQEKESSEFSGSLILDSQGILNSYNNESSIETPHFKSPFLAGTISFLIPGGGQLYNKDYWKSALFLAIEVTALTTALSYDSRGDEQTEVFEKYAKQNWDVTQYAEWTIANLENLNSNVNGEDYQVFYENGTVNWHELNRLESAIGGYYSHKLAPYEDQQYFEMIGKYPQFNVGWNDFGEGYENFVDAPFVYGDPLTDNFEYYSGERGKANDFYNTASTAVIVMVVNHILSAIEAAWSTSRYNKSLALNVDLKQTNLFYHTILTTQLNFKLNF